MTLEATVSLADIKGIHVMLSYIYIIYILDRPNEYHYVKPVKQNRFKQVIVMF